MPKPESFRKVDMEPETFQVIEQPREVWFEWLWLDKETWLLSPMVEIGVPLEHVVRKFQFLESATKHSSKCVTIEARYALHPDVVVSEYQRASLRVYLSASPW